jgi:hypothetical protein
MNYRQIWTKHNGTIPVDEQGRSYEIHHIDGDRSNNSLDNLQCVSLNQHYHIHLEQGDYHAAKMISKRLGQVMREVTPMPEQQRNQIRERMVGDRNPMKRPEVAKKVSNALKGRKKPLEVEIKRLKSREGFKHSEDTLLKMKKPKQKLTCPHCNQQGGNSQMKRWHLDNCKHKK